MKPGRVIPQVRGTSVCKRNEEYHLDMRPVAKCTFVLVLPMTGSVALGNTLCSLPIFSIV